MMDYSKYNDERAFELLLKRYRTQVYGFLFRAVGNRSTAEDLYQEAFFKLIRFAPRYRPKSTFRTFLFTIVRNALNDHYRKRSRNPTRYADDMDKENDGLELRADNASNPDILAGRLQIRAALDKALKELPPEQKEMFLLRQEAEMDFKEAARTAQCSVNTAKSRMRYALLKLRDLLRKYGVDPEGLTHEMP